MPEGDTVFRTAQRLTTALAGRRLVASQFRVPSLALVDLAGREVGATRSRGKHLLTEVGDVIVHSHLAMEGSWRTFALGQRWSRPGHTARVVLTTEDLQAVGFSLGVLDVVSATTEPAAVQRLGPDLLGPDWSPTEAVQRLQRDPDRSIYLALLDQHNLAGIGNVYASELCFLHGVAPTHPVADLDLARLVTRAEEALRLNATREIRSTTGSLRRGEREWVYGRAGQPCRRCGSTILSAEYGDPTRQRRAYWCPRCQPAPR